MEIATPRECAKLLLSHRNILILIHSNPDGDCIGSGAALAEMLLSAGKNVRLSCVHVLPKRLAFICEGLPEEVLCFGKEPDGHFIPDFIVSVDVASPELLGRANAEYADRINLCIDHHAINTVKADYILRLTDASAAGEIVLDVADALKEEAGLSVLSKSCADRLYAAIASDSGSFKYGNTTAKTLLYASRLKSLGADSEKISKYLFDTRSLAQFRLVGLAIPKTVFYCGGKLAYCILTEEELEEVGALKEDVDGITQIFREVEGVEMSIFGRQYFDSVTGGNRVKMSLRSNNDINVAEICEKFGGGGHVKAAGCLIRDFSNAEAEKLIVDTAIELNDILKD